MNTFQARIPTLALAIVGFLAFALSVIYVPTFSGFAAGAFKGALVIALSVAFDAFVLRRSNTFEQIVERQNVAYAVFFGLVVLAVAVAVSTA
jgi:hypothetical protein